MDPRPQIACREGYIELVLLLLGAVSSGKGSEGVMKGKDELKWLEVDDVNRGLQSPLMLALSPAVRATARLPVRQPTE